jgi:hypothetical protein
MPLLHTEHVPCASCHNIDTPMPATVITTKEAVQSCNHCRLDWEGLKVHTKQQNTPVTAHKFLQLAVAGLMEVQLGQLGPWQGRLQQLTGG